MDRSWAARTKLQHLLAHQPITPPAAPSAPPPPSSNGTGPSTFPLGVARTTARRLAAVRRLHRERHDGKAGTACSALPNMPGRSTRPTRWSRRAIPPITRRPRRPRESAHQAGATTDRRQGAGGLTIAAPPRHYRSAAPGESLVILCAAESIPAMWPNVRAIAARARSCRDHASPESAMARIEWTWGEFDPGAAVCGLGWVSLCGILRGGARG
jgi:hypothetical protein